MVLQTVHQFELIHCIVGRCEIDKNGHTGFFGSDALFCQYTYSRDVFANLCARPEPNLPVLDTCEEDRFQSC